MQDNKSSEPDSGSYHTLLETLATELACLRRESELRLGRCLARLNFELRRIEKEERVKAARAARERGAK